MKNVASYPKDSDCSIHTDKKVNLFYGLNGTGKSSIVHVIEDYQNDEKKYPECRLELDRPLNKADLFVYDDTFVQANFYAQISQKGIFALGSENVLAQKNVDIARQNIERNNKSLGEIEKKKQEVQVKSDNSLAEVQNTVFSIKQKYDRQTLDFCLEGNKKKEQFFQTLLSIPYEDIQTTFDELTDEKNDIDKHAGQTMSLFPFIPDAVENIEDSSIWKEPIISKGTSYMTLLINKMKSMSWFKNGVDNYLPLSQGKCPFCQQNLPNEFGKELENVFDTAYNEQKQKIEDFKNKYSAAISSIENYKYQKTANTVNLEHNLALLSSQMENNLREMIKKSESAESIVNLNKTEYLYKNVNDEITIVNEYIGKFNEKINNPATARNIIKNKFWKIIRKKFNTEITAYLVHKKDFTDELEKLTEKVRNIGRDNESQQKIIEANQDKIVNLEVAKDSINKELNLLGLSGFELAESKQHTGYYFLKREGTDENTDIYKTLSEGEKTLITFLYFIEFCKGTLDKDAVCEQQNRIVVIDDPVSSLSQNYVYEIANLIKVNFYIQKKDSSWDICINQLFVLTHNLYFLNECIIRKMNLKNQNYLYRVRKNICSEIVTMKENEIQNDYQAFWYLYKECIAGKLPPQVLPNIMRNILEYYFCFVHENEKLSEALNTLASKNPCFIALERYIDRGSHSDIKNISDFKNIDVHQYNIIFREIFVKTNFLNHYNQMMDIETNPATKTVGDVQ